MCNNNWQGTENYEEIKKQTAVMINECPWKVMTGGKLEHAAAWLVFSEPKRAHVTPLFVSMHWLPVVACIKFKTLMLAYKTTTGSAPTYFHSLLRIYIPWRNLRSVSKRRLVVPSQRGTKSLSRTFSFTVPGWWNELPSPIRNTEPLTIFKQHLKTHLFRLLLLLHKKNK